MRTECKINDFMSCGTLVADHCLLLFGLACSKWEPLSFINKKNRIIKKACNNMFLEASYTNGSIPENIIVFNN